MIEVKNLVKQYGNHAAVDDLSFTVETGKVVGFLGPNGAGKTTLILLLCRLYEPTQGRILLNGMDIREYDYEEYLAMFGVVFQDFKLFALPLGENVAAGRQYHAEQVEDCLKKAGFSCKNPVFLI